MRRLKILLLQIILLLPLARADDLATNLMLMNNYNLRQNTDIWSRIRAGFKLNHEETSRVKYYERLYTKHPRAFSALMAKAKPYLYFLLTEIERRGLPTELLFIPGIESTFNPLVERRDDAYAGMWQFVPSTGRRFNMQQNSEIDERRNIVKSSRAALNYFSYLYSIFRQWDIAIGAYNWGEGGMYQAILKSGQTLGRVDYSELKLRQITMDYEIKMVALANIIADPGKFGVKLDDTQNEPYFAIIHPQRPISLSDMIETSKANPTDFHKLNGQFKTKDYTLTQNNRILLPIVNQTIYYASLGGVTTTPNNPIVESGIMIATNDVIDTGFDSTDTSDDPIMNAANSYKDANAPVSYAPVNTKKAMNDLVDSLDDSDLTQEPQQPVTTSANSNEETTTGSGVEPATIPTVETPLASYIVLPHDTLYSISRKFNVSIDKLRQLNNIPGNNLIIGQKLKLVD